MRLAVEGLDVEVAVLALLAGALDRDPHRADRRPAAVIGRTRQSAICPLVTVRRDLKIGGLAVRSDGLELAIIDARAGRMRVLDVGTFQSLRELPTPAPFAPPTGRAFRFRYHLTDRAVYSPATGLAISPDGRFVAAVPRLDRKQAFKGAMLWDTRTSKRVTLRTDPTEATAVAFGAAGRVLVVGGLDGSITVWRIDSGRPLRRPRLAPPRTADGAVTELDFVDSGQSVYAVKRDAVLRFGVPNGEILERHQVNDGRVSIAPRARLAATIEKDGRVRLRRLPSWQQLGAAVTRTAILFSSTALSPDGRRLAVADGGLVSVWDTSSRVRLGQVSLTSDETSPSMLAWAGERLIMSVDGTLVTWDLSLAGMRRYACAMVHRSLTHAEWRAMLGDRKYVRLC